MRSVLHPLHSAALSDLTVSHHPYLFCFTETWIKISTTRTELTHCTPPNYTFLSIPRNERILKIGHHLTRYRLETQCIVKSM